jgi:phospho-N-acetylmuramoyl-pentapeptide-transferase
VIDFGVFYIPFVAFIVIGASNAVNLTDGLDGLAIGCVLIVAITLAALSYITGNVNFSEYLFLPFIKGTGELTVFCAAIIGASLGFLWFNCHPASVFMGDTGSLSLGGTLGVIAVLIKKEILLALIGGIFVLEAMSVILQVFSFRVFGKRIFKMSPFHHHLQLSGWSESKIIIRLWIIAIILALLTLTTLKIR